LDLERTPVDQVETSADQIEARPHRMERTLAVMLIPHCGTRAQLRAPTHFLEK